MNKKNSTTAFVVAIVVGSLLNLINSHHVFIDGDYSGKNIMEIMLTYITPFCVSLYSSSQAGRQINH